jgi:GMP synthase PP-ATPase subunit
MLAVLINRAKGEGQLSGVIPHLVHDSLSILQYADDTILFIDHNFEQARNMKLLLSAFEQLSDLKLISIKAKSSVLGKLKSMNHNMNNYLGVKKVHSRLDT